MTVALTPETRAALSLWVNARPPDSLPIFKFFRQKPDGAFPKADSDLGLGILLLVSALPLEWGGEGSLALLNSLWAEFQGEILRLYTVPPSRLEPIVYQALGLKALHGDHAKIPAILRSVSEFISDKPPLTVWLNNAVPWETKITELAQTIYYMGKYSPHPIKARRYFLLAKTALAGKPLPPAESFLWPISRGHIRFYREILKPKQSRNFDAQSWMVFFRDFGKAFHHEGGWILYQALSGFLEPSHEKKPGFQCQIDWGGCKQCHWHQHCPIPLKSGLK
jgi:hypothetical protein